VQHLLWQRDHTEITHKKIFKEVQRKSDTSLEKSEREVQDFRIEGSTPVEACCSRVGGGMDGEVLGICGEHGVKLDSGEEQRSYASDGRRSCSPNRRGRGWGARAQGGRLSKVPMMRHKLLAGR
jgi:hypothetical protein